MPDGPNRAPGRAVTPCQTLAIQFTLPLSSKLTIDVLLCGVSKTQLTVNAAHSEIASTAFEEVEHDPHVNILWFLALVRCSMTL
jgi:hypothetical protein